MQRFVVEYPLPAGYRKRCATGAARQVKFGRIAKPRTLGVFRRSKECERTLIEAWRVWGAKVPPREREESARRQRAQGANCSASTVRRRNRTASYRQRF